LNTAIMALILVIAAEVGISPEFALAIALEENWTLNPNAVYQNQDGTFDGGVMQLNSSWFKGDWQNPEENIRAGCLYIKGLVENPLTTTYWSVAVCYNAGTRWLTRKEKPPDRSIEYAERVMARFEKLEKERVEKMLQVYFEARDELFGAEAQGERK